MGFYKCYLLNDYSMQLLNEELFILALA